MTFSLTLSVSDLLLLLPELFLTAWLCVILIVDFSFKRIVQEQLAYLSILGLVITLACLAWFDVTGITGTLFGKMFVLDRMAIFFKVMILLATILVILLSIDYVHRFAFFRGGNELGVQRQCPIFVLRRNVLFVADHGGHGIHKARFQHAHLALAGTQAGQVVFKDDLAAHARDTLFVG